MQTQATHTPHSAATAPLMRRAVSAREISVLADIYAPQNHLAVWQRDLQPALSAEVKALLADVDHLRIEGDVTPTSAAAFVQRKSLSELAVGALSSDIAELVDMFCCLFDLQASGLRLTMLDRAMCPRFHVDRVPCRLVTTYQGAATQWLPHECVDRSRLGHGSQGQPDAESGLYRGAESARQMRVGDVALLKGEEWEGNEHAGLVHRSPSLAKGEKRLLLTLDFIA